MQTSCFIISPGMIKTPINQGITPPEARGSDRALTRPSGNNTKTCDPTYRKKTLKGETFMLIIIIITYAQMSNTQLNYTGSKQHLALAGTTYSGHQTSEPLGTITARFMK